MTSATLAFTNENVATPRTKRCFFGAALSAARTVPPKNGAATAAMEPNFKEITP